MMKYLICVGIAVGGSVRHCNADDFFRYYRASDGSRTIEHCNGLALAPQDNYHAYDNLRDSTSGGVTNQSRGIYRYGVAEVADDLTLVTLGPALISDLGFSIFNTSTTATLTQYHITHRFYDSQHTLLGADAFTVVDAPIAAGRGAVFVSEGGFYTPFGIVVPTQVFMSIQISNVVGIDPADIGIRMAGPRTTGYSSQFIYNFTNGQTLDFDGSDQTNMKFYINTVDVPAPAATPLFIGALACAFRRRR